jgi:hypothetical protein
MEFCEVDMLLELPDKRLTRIMPEEEFRRLEARAREAYAKIERVADEPVLRAVLELLLVLREVELRLLEDRFRDVYVDAYRQGARMG